MKRLLGIVPTILLSRATAPLVMGFFLLVYVAVAFVTDEALILLMQLTRSSAILMAILSLLPLNAAARTVAEVVRWRKTRHAVTGRSSAVPPELFDETVELTGSPSLELLQGRLESVGYRTSRGEGHLGAWRGVSVSPARVLFLAGIFCLFSGILVSLGSRTSSRTPLIEGEQLPGGEKYVEQIRLQEAAGPILARELFIGIGSTSGGDRRNYGIYPPSLLDGSFVYPRYLGIGLFIRLKAPDPAGTLEKFSILNIYRPGKEDTADLPGSPYRLVVSLIGSDDGTDPYVTGRMKFNVKLLKGKEVVLTGSVPSGGELVQDGYRIALPEARRLVITDFVHDYGVILIWSAMLLFLGAGLVWLPVRMFLPRGEMLFRAEGETVCAYSRAEGRERTHGGVFHEALDLLDEKKAERNQPVGEPESDRKDDELGE